MSQQSQKFCTSHAKSSTWTPGLRTFFEYRDLGIGDATKGQFNAHVIRVKNRLNNFPTPAHTPTNSIFRCSLYSKDG